MKCLVPEELAGGTPTIRRYKEVGASILTEKNTLFNGMSVEKNILLRASSIEKNIFLIE